MSPVHNQQTLCLLINRKPVWFSFSNQTLSILTKTSSVASEPRILPGRTRCQTHPKNIISTEFRSTVSYTKPHKAAGPENLPGHLLRDSAHQLVEILIQVVCPQPCRLPCYGGPKKGLVSIITAATHPQVFRNLKSSQGALRDRSCTLRNLNFSGPNLHITVSPQIY